MHSIDMEKEYLNMDYVNKVLGELLNDNPGCEVIFLTKFGSQLYGTDTPESDLDIKGVFVPSQLDVYLGKFPDSIQSKSTKGKNTSDDIDIQLYSIQHFFRLAKLGDTNALDMLHAGPNAVLHSSLIWEAIRDQRKMFYTKTLKAFIGYAKKQADKYGLKGERLDSIKNCIEVMDNYQDTDKLSLLWNYLPQDKHGNYIQDTPGLIKQYMICGKTLQETMSVLYAKKILQRYQDEYGGRALDAQKNSGIDWKAISHALRAAIEVRSILEVGDVTFPLVLAPFLKDVKNGKIDYHSISCILDYYIEQINKLSEVSNLPEVVDSEACDMFLFVLLTAYYGG